MRNVAVVFGGRSMENEISVLTGLLVMNVLDGEKYQIVPLYLHTDGGMYTAKNMKDLQVFKEKKFSSFTRVVLEGGCVYEMNEAKRRWKKIAKIDVAINCCHGGFGEGGGVSALMEYNDIPFASPDLTSSGVFMDKCMTKLVMRALGVPSLDYIRVNEQDYRKRGAFLLKSIEGRLKYPVIVKPAHLGSSIGVAVANDEEEARRAIESAFELDERVIVEKYLDNKRDVNCAVCCLHGEICVSEIETAFGDGVYSFEDKYVKQRSDGGSVSAGKMVNGGGRYALSGDLREKIRAYSKTIYKRMNLFGVVRMDFLVSGDKVYLCEVNTVPGSLAYYLFCERISDARTFFGDLIEEAVVEHAQKKKRVYDTGILSCVRWERK